MDAILLDLFGTVVAYGDVAQGTRVAWEGIYAVLQELGSPLAYDAFVPLWEEAFNTPWRRRTTATRPSLWARWPALCAIAACPSSWAR